MAIDTEILIVDDERENVRYLTIIPEAFLDKPIEPDAFMEAVQRVLTK
jgi:hypothetical protein